MLVHTCHPAAWNESPSAPLSSALAPPQPPRHYVAPDSTRAAMSTRTATNAREVYYRHTTFRRTRSSFCLRLADFFSTSFFSFLYSINWEAANFTPESWLPSSISAFSCSWRCVTSLSSASNVSIWGRKIISKHLPSPAKEDASNDWVHLLDAGDLPLSFQPPSETSYKCNYYCMVYIDRYCIIPCIGRHIICHHLNHHGELRPAHTYTHTHGVGSKKNILSQIDKLTEREARGTERQARGTERQVRGTGRQASGTERHTRGTERQEQRDWQEEQRDRHRERDKRDWLQMERQEEQEQNIQTGRERERTREGVLC